MIVLSTDTTLGVEKYMPSHIADPSPAVLFP
jgi:hypothetical protein